MKVGPLPPLFIPDDQRYAVQISNPAHFLPFQPRLSMNLSYAKFLVDPVSSLTGLHGSRYAPRHVPACFSSRPLPPL